MPPLSALLATPRFDASIAAAMRMPANDPASDFPQAEGAHADEELRLARVRALLADLVVTVIGDPAALAALAEGAAPAALTTAAPTTAAPMSAVPAAAPRSRLVESLTPREREVLELIAQGASNKRIALRLDLSVHTVKRHVANVLGKLGVHSRGEAIALYLGKC